LVANWEIERKKTTRGRESDADRVIPYFDESSQTFSNNLQKYEAGSRK